MSRPTVSDEAVEAGIRALESHARFLRPYEMRDALEAAHPLLSCPHVAVDSVADAAIASLKARVRELEAERDWLRDVLTEAGVSLRELLAVIDGTNEASFDSNRRARQLLRDPLLDTQEDDDDR